VPRSAPVQSSQSAGRRRRRRASICSACHLPTDFACSHQYCSYAQLFNETHSSLHAASCSFFSFFCMLLTLAIFHLILVILNRPDSVRFELYLISGAEKKLRPSGLDFGTPYEPNHRSIKCDWSSVGVAHWVDQDLIL